MADLINLSDIMRGGDEGKRPSTKRRAPDTRKSRKNPDVEFIQKLLTEHGLPVGKRKPMEADGVYGPTTHASLAKFVNAFHTSEEVRQRVAKIKPLMTEEWREMLPKLGEIAKVLKAEVVLPEEVERAAPGAAPKKPDAPEEQFDIVIEVGGKKRRFPIMAAVRSPGHLLYALNIHGFYDRNAPIEKRMQQILDANTFLNKFIPEDWHGVKTVLADYSKFLYEKLETESTSGDPGKSGPAKMPMLIDWLSARFPTILPNIPKSQMRAITRYIYSLDPRMISSPNLDAKITDLRRLQSHSPSIHHQLVLMMRNAPVSTPAKRTPISAPFSSVPKATWTPGREVPPAPSSPGAMPY